ncbi:DUF4123 domain-containing protein [Citrobacter arsenatis]|uniref:DUF4123 domain-containing protein n=1 Tax=Citrobacter arsenatis TaxID=2546350 RepID=UPI00300DFCDF
MNTNMISPEPLRLYKHTHVLIDRIFYPDPPASWQAEPVVNSVLKPQAELYPWLVELENLDVEETENLTTLIRSSDNLPATMLFHSDYRGQSLIQCLADLLIFQQHYTGKRYLLRYYDSRVFIQLVRMFTHAQLRNFCSRAGVNFFSWIDSAGGATFIPFDKSAITEGISSETCRRILNAGIINTVIQQHSKLADLNEFIVLSDCVENLIDIATLQLGMTDRNDIIAFATKGLNYHHQFYLAKPIIELIEKTKYMPGLFSAEIDLLNKDCWVAICQYCQGNAEERE